MTNILLIAGRYQLGNNEGLFQDAHDVGYGLELPFRKTWIDTDAKEIGFVFHTTDVETWGDWKGHRVAINGQEIGAAQGSVRHLRSCRSLHDQSADSDLGEDSERKRKLRVVGRTGEAAYAARLVGQARSDQNRDRRNTGSVLRVEVIQPGCSQSDSSHDAAAEVRRVPPRQNCAKISGCIGSRIPPGERGPRLMRETCVRSRSRLRRQLSCCSPGLLSGRLMPRQGLARSVLPERLRITLRSILWPAASMRFAGRATPWCAGCSTAGAPVVAVFIAET